MSQDLDRSPCEDWWATSIIEMQPGHDPLSRLRDRGPHRPGQLPSDDLADAARRTAERGPGRAARHRADGGGRPRAAGALDRHRPHGRDLRRRHQQRHGLGDQRAGRRARRRRRAVRRALPGNRRPHRRWRVELAVAVEAELAALAERGIKFVPGFGHRFHPIDPRAPRLLEVVEAAAAEGVVAGGFAAIGRAVEEALARRKGGKRIPMNIDGATAVIYAELGFPPPLCRGPVRPVALGGRPGPCLGADAGWRAQQGPDPAPLPVALSRRRTAPRDTGRVDRRLSQRLANRNLVRKARADVFHDTCDRTQAGDGRSGST